MNSTESKIYDFIVENCIATEAEIQLVTNINGWNVEALNDIIFARTGYHDPEQCHDCEPENYMLSDELRAYYGLDDDEEEEEEE